MPKKIVIINGSPTPGGNTRCLSEAVLEGVKEAGNEGVIVDLSSFSIAPYLGSMQAEDDMSKVVAEMRTADAVVIASPLYGCSSPARSRSGWTGSPRSARRFLPEKKRHFSPVPQARPR